MRCLNTGLQSKCILMFLFKIEYIFDSDNTLKSLLIGLLKVFIVLKPVSLEAEVNVFFSKIKTPNANIRG
jgi:hypothetical protein